MLVDLFASRRVMWGRREACDRKRTTVSLLLVRGAMEQLWRGMYVLGEGLNIQRNMLLASSHGEAWRSELGRRRVTSRTQAIHHTSVMKANLLLDFQESWEREATVTFDQLIGAAVVQGVLRVR